MDDLNVRARIYVLGDVYAAWTAAGQFIADGTDAAAVFNAVYRFLGRWGGDVELGSGVFKHVPHHVPMGVRILSIPTESGGVDE